MSGSSHLKRADENPKIEYPPAKVLYGAQVEIRNKSE